MESTGETDKVYDGADVGGVGSSAGEAGVGGRIDEVGGGPGGKGGSDGLCVAVIEQGLGAGLGEAGVLLIEGAFGAVDVGTQRERSGEEV